MLRDGIDAAPFKDSITAAMRILILSVFVCCHWTLLPAALGAPVGSLAVTVSQEEMGVYVQQEPPSVLPVTRATRDFLASSFVGFVLFVFIVAPLLLKHLEKETKHPAVH